MSPLEEAADRLKLSIADGHLVTISNRVYITRDGLLAKAHRSGHLDGIVVERQDENPTHWTARVAVYRKDMSHPFTYDGRYPKSGTQKKYGPEMAVKCAEVMALRRAFDVTGIGTLEEQHDVAPDPWPDRVADLQELAILVADLGDEWNAIKAAEPNWHRDYDAYTRVMNRVTAQPVAASPSDTAARDDSDASDAATLTDEEAF
jgi:hypothetical protein